MCECAILERINKKVSLTFLYTYVRKFGIVSPKSPMSSNQWARPCPRALENRTTEHWRTMHRKSNGNSLVHHDFFFLFHQIFSMNIQKNYIPFFFIPRQYFQNNVCQKNCISIGKIRAMETHLYAIDYFFFFHKNFPMNIQNDSLLFFRMPC